MLPALSPLLKRDIPCSTVASLFFINPHGRRRRSFTTHEWDRGPSRSCVPAIRAAVRSGDKSTVGARISNAPSSDTNGSLSSSTEISVQAVLIIKKKMKEKLNEKFEDHVESFFNGIGQGVVIQLVSEEIDPVTKAAKLSVQSAARGWMPNTSKLPYIIQYAVNLVVPSSFGRPGAVKITNLRPKEFYLVEIVLHGFNDGPIFFPSNSWIHSKNDNPECRIIFNNKAYLASQTPDGLKELRQGELTSLRGNGKGERKKHDRIYDYAPYNDLGNPDKDEDLARLTLAGEERPYPRRCRTGRPSARSDSLSEGVVEKPKTIYVPRDETFEEIKQASFSAGKVKALFHNLMPSLVAALSSSDNPFQCFTEIDELYKDGIMLKDDEQHFVFEKLLLPSMMKKLASAGERLLKYETPAIIQRDRFSWLRDNEFARQALAGVNPVNIQRLREFPIKSNLDPAVYGPPESAITKDCIEQELNGMSIEEAIETGRLFILDYHDILLPFIKKMNALKNRKAYASRTVFVLSNKSGCLKPVAIELTLPPKSSTSKRKYVYTNGHDATSYWTWKLAKAHVCSNDVGVHQLVNHWLRTHACMEPYILATHRQLSFMHPVYKLLHPHMRYTMEINALARQSLINGGGIIESCFSPDKYSMEVSAAAYKSMWRFDMEGLPADLLRRGMAVEDPSQPCGIKLVLEDYPYAADGLLIWSAIKDWVEAYVGHFYSEPSSVESDSELQAWWDEIINKGHYDKRHETWWPQLKTSNDLSSILTTMIWTASGLHAAVNFGQYPFGGYVPNRPALMRKLIPQPGEPEFEQFLLNPQKTFLKSIPTQLQATKVMAVQDTLSTHSPDEEYLGELHQSDPHWIDDQKIVSLFKKFSTRLEEVDEIINERNRDLSLTSRTGAGVPPYELLLPSSGPGVTARGIPNSISI